MALFSDPLSDADCIALTTLWPSVNINF
jgi:hypothetical protein